MTKDFYNKIEASLDMYTLLNDEAKNVIDNFIEKLPDKQKEFARLRYNELLTYEEIAERLNYTTRNVFNLRRKVLDKFWVYLMTNKAFKIS